MWVTAVSASTLPSLCSFPPSQPISFPVGWPTTTDAAVSLSYASCANSGRTPIMFTV